VYFAVSRDDAPALAGKLFAEMGGRLQTITCVETRAGMELMYHVAFGTANLSCTLRTLLPVPSPDVESLTPVIPAAEWIEREIHELFGVNFRNHPNLEHLILADDWPEGEYPLRRRAE
jgi:NADH:ubiquinone oxidoreductase subunit C